MKKILKIEDLPLNPANANHPTPLYYQIETDLRRLILQGDIAPDDVLPPELELSRAYGVGRHTMREALSRLVNDNLITRRAGLGTIVNRPVDRTPFFLNRSFSHQMAAMGRQAHSKILDQGVGVFDETDPRALQAYVGRRYFFIQRLRLGDDEPIGIQSTYLRHDLCIGIEDENLENESLYDVLASRYQVVITQIDHTVTAETANEPQAELLQIPFEAPLLFVNTIAYIQPGELIEFTRSYYRADRYEYKTSAVFSP